MPYVQMLESIHISIKRCTQYDDSMMIVDDKYSAWYISPTDTKLSPITKVKIFEGCSA